MRTILWGLCAGDDSGLNTAGGSVSGSVSSVIELIRAAVKAFEFDFGRFRRGGDCAPESSPVAMSAAAIKAGWTGGGGASAGGFLAADPGLVDEEKETRGWWTGLVGEVAARVSRFGRDGEGEGECERDPLRRVGESEHVRSIGPPCDS